MLTESVQPPGFSMHRTNSDKHLSRKRKVCFMINDSWCNHNNIQELKSFCSPDQEFKFTGSDTRRMWQGLQEIMDYKKKTSHVMDTGITLLDKRNTFFARFKDNTVPPSRPTNKDSAPPPSPWPTWVKHLSVLTLAGQLAQTASLAASSEHAQTSWLVYLRIYSIAPYPSLLSPNASRWIPLFLYPRRQT